MGDSDILQTRSVSGEPEVESSDRGLSDNKLPEGKPIPASRTLALMSQLRLEMGRISEIEFFDDAALDRLSAEDSALMTVIPKGLPTIGPGTRFLLEGRGVITAFDILKPSRPVVEGIGAVKWAVLEGWARQQCPDRQRLAAAEPLRRIREAYRDLKRARELGIEGSMSSAEWAAQEGFPQPLLEHQRWSDQVKIAREQEERREIIRDRWNLVVRFSFFFAGLGFCVYLYYGCESYLDRNDAQLRQPSTQYPHSQLNSDWASVPQATPLVEGAARTGGVSAQTRSQENRAVRRSRSRRRRSSSEAGN
jgi:hypothetical protein